jgi:cytochrome c-type biogenesis protein CcmH/NrfG
VNTKDMLFGVVVFSLGLVAGIFIGSRQTTPPPGPPAAMAPPGAFGSPPAMPQGVGGGEDKVARINVALQVVQRDPKNAAAWVQLGNDYFDTNQHQKSIDAYARALELQPNNPDVLTDQGVMYRAVGKFDEAIAVFEKAQQAAPTHMQSLLNMAVVYDNDLKKPEKAVAVLEKVAKADPTGQYGRQAAEYLAAIKARPKAP